MKKSYIFVIDTEHYAGNFVREMCAYITGNVGDCGVGMELAEVSRGEISADTLAWIDRHIEQRPDEHGCARPCSIHATPGYFNDGNGHEYRDLDGENKKGYPAYMSVGIFFDMEPPDDVRDEIIARARVFASERPDKRRWERAGIDMGLTLSRSHSGFSRRRSLRDAFGI